jgi:hypothetical protein
VELVTIYISAIVLVDHSEQVANRNSILDETLIDFVESFFLKSDDRFRNIVSSRPGCSLFFINFDFIFLENGQELFIVNSSLVVLPEVIDEGLKCLSVHSQIQISKHILEFCLRDDSIAAFVDHFKEICHVHFCTFGCFHHLVNDSLILTSVSDSEAFKLTDEFVVADTTTAVVVQRVPEDVHLSR